MGLTEFCYNKMSVFFFLWEKDWGQGPPGGHYPWGSILGGYNKILGGCKADPTNMQ